MTHELESGRDWVRIDRACELADRDRATVWRWVTKGYVRSQKLRGKTFVSVLDLMATEASLAAAEQPTTRRTVAL